MVNGRSGSYPFTIYYSPFTFLSLITHHLSLLFEVQMFYRNPIRLAIALLVLSSLFVGGQFTSRARAQQNQANTQSTTQRSTVVPQASPRPSPRPSASPGQEEETLPSDEVVRVETDLTNILFTAVDHQRRFITNLRQEDIRVTEDGVPQEVFTFARQVDLPLSLAILVDTSVSEERTLPSEKEAASEFVNSVLRSGHDEAAVVSFTGESTLEQGLTGNSARVRRALDRVEFVPPAGYVGNGQVAGTPPISGTNNQLAGSTAIWDAIWVTADEILSQTSEHTRRAIILLTDGGDSSSKKKMAEAIERANRADVVVYAIGIGDPYRYGINEGALRKVSEQTGGRAFFPHNESDLRAAFNEIEQELRSQYLVAYSPTNKNRDGSWRRVQIEIVNQDLQRQKLKLTYRQGYFAKSSTTPTPAQSPRRQ